MTNDALGICSERKAEHQRATIAPLAWRTPRLAAVQAKVPSSVNAVQSVCVHVAKTVVILICACQCFRATSVLNGVHVFSDVASGISSRPPA